MGWGCCSLNGCLSREDVQAWLFFLTVVRMWGNIAGESFVLGDDPGRLWMMLA